MTSAGASATIKYLVVFFALIFWNFGESLIKEKGRAIISISISICCTENFGVVWQVAEMLLGVCSPRRQNLMATQDMSNKESQ